MIRLDVFTSLEFTKFNNDEFRLSPVQRFYHPRGYAGQRSNRVYIPRWTYNHKRTDGMLTVCLITRLSNQYTYAVYLWVRASAKRQLFNEISTLGIIV